MKKRINYLVLVENRPFSFLDFLHFEVDGKEYSMVHGTFRNKISKLVKDGNVVQHSIAYRDITSLNAKQ